jgi:hypothetical protein
MGAEEKVFGAAGQEPGAPSDTTEGHTLIGQDPYSGGVDAINGAVEIEPIGSNADPKEGASDPLIEQSGTPTSGIAEFRNLLRVDDGAVIKGVSPADGKYHRQDIAEGHAPIVQKIIFDKLSPAGRKEVDAKIAGGLLAHSDVIYPKPGTPAHYNLTPGAD